MSCYAPLSTTLPIRLRRSQNRMPRRVLQDRPQILLCNAERLCYIVALSNGIPVQASRGVGKAELSRTVEFALSTWPGA
jgi:hypothetical protein